MPATRPSRPLARRAAAAAALGVIGLAAQPAPAQAGTTPGPKPALRTIVRTALTSAASARSTPQGTAQTSPPTPVSTQKAPMTTSTTPTSTVGAFLHMTNPSYANIAQAGTIVLQQHQYGQIPAIRRARPDVKIFMYSNSTAASTAAGNGSYQPSVITWPQLQAHPEWVLKGANGTPARWGDYTYLQPFDQGNKALQQLAYTNLKTELFAHGWDGVLLDDVNVDMTGHYWNVAPVNFTGGSLYAATDSFLRAVGPALKAVGKQVAVNMQTRWDFWDKPVSDWTPLVDAVNLEHCTTWSEQADKSDGLFLSGLDATWRINEMTKIQALGGRVWCHDYGGAADVRAQHYHRALFLMAWDGASASASMWTPAPWTASWYNQGSTVDLGAPLGPATLVTTDVRKRVFAKATLYLNTSTTTKTVSTGSGTITLAPLRAALG